MILTYALCGFANFSSIGIQLGGIGGIAPDRRSDLARLGLRAMVGGTLAAFMTACVAGFLLSDDDLQRRNTPGVSAEKNQTLDATDTTVGVLNADHQTHSAMATCEQFHGKFESLEKDAATNGDWRLCCHGSGAGRFLDRRWPVGRTRDSGGWRPAARTART